jgi:beta-galactosidase
MKKYPFGTVYLIEQERSLKETKRDLDNIRAMGFNLVTLWPIANSWLTKDPKIFVFDATLRVLDLCWDRGMKAIIQLIGQNQAQEYMPDCLLTAEMVAMDENGKLPNCFWANPNHPKVTAVIKQYLQEAVGALKNHPAVYAWDIFNEAHLRTDDPWTTQKYHVWLKRKYHTIENLNRKWYRRFSKFSEINPRERRAAYSIWSSLLPAVDYELFRADNLTDLCAQWAGWVKAIDRKHPVMVDGSAAQLLADDVTERNNDEFATAKVCDIYGGTYYPKSWGRDLTDRLFELAMRYEMSKAAADKAKKPFVINELQTHTQSALSPGSEVSPQALAAWIWTGIAIGAKSMQLWRWRPFLHGYQSTGRGLTAMDGAPNARARAVKDLVRVLNRNEALIQEAKPVKPAVKIVLSYRNRAFYDAFMKWGKTNYPDELKGWYRLFWDRGIPVSFTEFESLSREDMTCPVLVLPALISISRRECRRLRDYVKRGGLLIADGRLGTVNEWGEVPPDKIPGKGLSRLFGFTEEDVDRESEFIFKGKKVQAPFMVQYVRPLKGSRVLARYANKYPAIVQHKLGKGSTLYFTSFLGVQFHNDRSGILEDYLVKKVLSVSPALPYVRKSEKVHVSFQQMKNQTVVFVVSTSDKKEKVTFFNLEKRSKTLELPLNPWEFKILLVTRL